MATNDDTLVLAGEFPPATREAWLKLVDGVLKGAPFERLVSKTADGLAIEPLYARARDAPVVAGRAASVPWQDLSKVFVAAVTEAKARGFEGPLAVADGRVIHDAGGSEAQELAYVLAIAVAYLRALEAAGIALDEARGMLQAYLSADADQLLTIAKFRALRRLWARVEQACGLHPKPLFIAGETAWRMLTQRDTDVNMLRATMATFAAGLGGADSITLF